jgi:hypothetical protein
MGMGGGPSEVKSSPNSCGDIISTSRASGWWRPTAVVVVARGRDDAKLSVLIALTAGLGLWTLVLVMAGARFLLTSVMAALVVAVAVMVVAAVVVLVLLVVVEVVEMGAAWPGGLRAERFCVIVDFVEPLLFVETLLVLVLRFLG